MRGLVVDNFAGGGGASVGIERALGRPVDIAVNHDAEAIAMHQANHPDTKHFCEDIWQVDPREACGSSLVDLAWFSPDCKHFSRAKGSKPVDTGIRGLAWVVIRWAEAVQPKVIMLENVEEFEGWGPLDDEGRPIKTRVGETFRDWMGRLSDLGYAIEFRSIVAADHGAPTTRRRLFLIARRDEGGITWPEPTHGRGARRPWLPASEVVDWSLPCPSIFERKRPLAPATLARIAAGIQRYVVETAHPFVLSAAGSLATPFVVRHGHYSHRTGAGLRPGCGAGTFRGQSLRRPLATVCATNDKHICVPLITKHYGGMVGHDCQRTLGTVTSKDHHAVTAAWLSHGGQRREDVQAFMSEHGGGDGSLEIGGERYVITDIGMRMFQPHELFAAQGFPDDHVIDLEIAGKRITKTAQIRLAGNSVCPPVSEALVGINVCGREAAA